MESKYDFYDFEKAEEIREAYNKKLINIYKRYSRAKEKGKAVSMAKAVTSLRRHKESENQLKAWAEEAGFCWY